MADLVVIPLGPLGVLELPREVYEQHLRPVTQNATGVAISTQAHDLVTARSLAHTLSLPLSSVYELARLEKIPSVRVGKHVRFSPPAVRQALEATDAASPARR